jgi:signal transduction histidine kinase
MQHEIFGAINPPKYREYINYINTSGRHLLSLITDILDIARIEANRIELYEEEVVPAMIMADVEGIARSEAESAGITLAVQGDASLPNLYADSRRLVQILLNLVANAVKFSPQGSTVSLQALRSAQGLVFSVVDKGVGMRPEDIEKALTPFTQLHQDAAVARKGSGLGLAIVKGLTEAHGGQLHIESKPGEGTTVYVVMPHKRIIAARRTA